jgi:hypothetical protein
VAYVQIGRARVEVKVQGLTTNVDWREEESGILLGSRNNSASLVCCGGLRSRPILSAFILLCQANHSLFCYVLSRFEVVFTEHLPHGSHSIGTGGVSSVQLPWDLERTFLNVSPA